MRAYGAMAKKEPTNYHDYSDTRPDLTLMVDALKAYDLKVLCPVGSEAGDVAQRGVGDGAHALQLEHALVHGKLLVRALPVRLLPLRRRGAAVGGRRHLQVYGQ